MANWLHESKRNSWEWLETSLNKYRPIDLRAVKLTTLRLRNDNFSDYDINLWVRDDSQVPTNPVVHYTVKSYKFTTTADVAHVLSIIKGEEAGPNGATADGEDILPCGPIATRGNATFVLLIQRKAPGG